MPALAYAQQGLQLRPQPSLLEVPDKDSEDTPAYFEGDRLQGYGDREIEATGNARMRRRGESFFADWMRHNMRDNELYAIGNVRVEQGAQITEGARLRYNLDTSKGLMENTRFALNPKAIGGLPVPGGPLPGQDGRGTAEKIVFEGPGLFRAQQASYTTCEPGNDDWYVRGRQISIDQNQDVGVARDAFIDFKGQTILYSPYLSFSLHNQRKSGFLTPHFGNSSTSGFETSAPFYWNIAPNRDATLTPRLLTKRGLQLRSEFRYLEPSYKGEVRYEYLPGDSQINRDRQAFSIQHAHNFSNGWSGSLDIQQVSDAKYFTDLSTQITLTSLTNLPRQGTLSRGGGWGSSGTYSFSALVQSWQTLQTDPLAPLTPPYSRRPQLTLTAQNQNVLAGDFDLLSSFVYFSHPTLISGRRIVAYPTLSFPLQTSYAYVTPKVGVHATRYMLDQNFTTSDKTRVLPVLSAESGLIFERDTKIFGNAFRQTLEPKLYYVYIPYKDQTQLPNFESGLQDINFATIFSENQFSGSDRINNANQVTAGVSSRLIHPDTGVEIIRVGVAQRYYFSPQRVTLPGTTIGQNQSSRSDVLAALSGTVAPHWIADLGWQYNTDRSETQRMTVATRYQPQQGKLLNLSYRHQINSFKQFDISGQWPIAGKWTAVGRWNYSTQDKRLLEGVAGMEYDGGCWAFRVVAHRISTATQTSSTAVFFELELNGVTRIGSNPLDILRRNIAGYSRYDPNAPRPNEYFVPER